MPVRTLAADGCWPSMAAGAASRHRERPALGSWQVLRVGLMMVGCDAGTDGRTAQVDVDLVCQALLLGQAPRLIKAELVHHDVPVLLHGLQQLWGLPRVEAALPAPLRAHRCSQSGLPPQLSVKHWLSPP